MFSVGSARKRHSLTIVADSTLLRLLSEPTCEGLAGTDAALQAAILTRAHRHKAAVLLASKVHSSSFLLEPIRDELTRLLKAAIVRDAELVSVTAELTHRFQDAHLDAIIYKGPVLWRSLGLSSPIRISGDLDVLVYPSSVSCAETLLSRMGYQCARRWSHEATYLCGERPKVDLHWNLISGGGLGHRLEALLDEIWSACQMLEVAGGLVRTLPHAQLMIALALHAACHHLCRDWTSLYEISCMSRVQRTHDWAYIKETAEQLKIAHVVYHPLYIARTYFSASVPEELLDQLRTSYRHRLLGLIASAGFGGRLASRRLVRVGRMAWNLLSISDFRNALHWVRDTLGYRLRTPF